MNLIKRYRFPADIIICSFALMIFSFFIHYKLPVKLVSFASLLVAAFIFNRRYQLSSDFKSLFSNSYSLAIKILFIVSGLLLGILYAVLYRWHLDITLFPASVHLFVLAAAMIGSVEELVFRGFIQDSVKGFSGPVSILFSTLSHTGYKCCLFLAPVLAVDVNIGFLAFWTFFAGLLSGILRHISKSILPSMIAHALFDILVYAEFISAPWWVW
jgi:membrane protease YdiL (CAAX protease family)